MRRIKAAFDPDGILNPDKIMGVADLTHDDGGAAPSEDGRDGAAGR